MTAMDELLAFIRALSDLADTKRVAPNHERIPFPLRFVHIPDLTFNVLIAEAADGEAESAARSLFICDGTHAAFAENANRAYGGHGEETPTTRLPPAATMYDVLVAVGIFPSRGQARKNWQGPTEIPLGYSEFLLGTRRNRRVVFVFRAA